jgi:hypothetical protein
MSDIGSRLPQGWARRAKVPFVWVLRALIVVSFGFTAVGVLSATPTTEPPPSPSGAASSTLTNVGQDAQDETPVQVLVEPANSGKADAPAVVLGEQIVRNPDSSAPFDVDTAYSATQLMPVRIGPSPSRDQPSGIWRLAQFSH